MGRVDRRQYFTEQWYFKEWFNNLPPESRVRQCKDMMFSQLNKLNMVDAVELKAYINRIVDDMEKAACRYGESPAGLRGEDPRQDRNTVGSPLSGNF